jgi:hypothetical protein
LSYTHNQKVLINAETIETIPRGVHGADRTIEATVAITFETMLRKGRTR